MGSSERSVVLFTAAPEVRGGEVNASAIKIDAWGRHTVLVELPEGREPVGLRIWEPFRKGEQRSRDRRLEFAATILGGDSVRMDLRPVAMHELNQEQPPGSGSR